MFPLGDADRRPVLWPIITILIIALNVAMFLAELVGGETFITHWSVVPANIVAGKGWVTILTSMFMHAGVAHIAGNMLFFWAFGPEIEDAMGRIRYSVFYLLGGFVASVAQILIDPTSTVPNLGASGAIAAVLGAFLITYPRDRIRTLVLLGWFTNITLIPAIILVGLWFLTQLVSELGALATVQSGGVAYMAHIGGFLFGMVTCRIFEKNRPRPDDWQARYR
jgi:membrane associated rhomboid family serine protease